MFLCRACINVTKERPLKSRHANGAIALLLAPVVSITFSPGIVCAQCRSGGQTRQGTSPGVQLQTQMQYPFLQQGQPGQYAYLQQGQLGDGLLQQMDLQYALRMQELGWLLMLQQQRQQQRGLTTIQRRDPELPVVWPSSPPTA